MDPQFGFAASETGLGHSLTGGEEQLVFLGILAIGLVFEGISPRWPATLSQTAAW